MTVTNINSVRIKVRSILKRSEGKLYLTKYEQIGKIRTRNTKRKEEKCKYSHRITRQQTGIKKEDKRMPDGE